MQQKASFSWLYVPLSVLLFLSFALFVERSGISYSVTEKPETFLSPLSVLEEESTTDPITRESTCLVLSNSTGVADDKSLDTVTAALASMKVPYDQHDVEVSKSFDLSSYETLIITFVELSRIDDSIDELTLWVKNGGKLLFAIRPDNSMELQKIYVPLGIGYLDKGYIESDGIEMLTPLLPGGAGMHFGLDFMTHSSLPVNLTEDTILHLISADTQGVPIMWETAYGDGKIVMINSDQFIDKSNRGLIGSAYSLLQDVVIYPVINAATFHIDDFPAPIPEGIDEVIFSQFTRDIKNFYLNVWWPDIQDLKEKYNLVFSTFIIETYDYILNPPFIYNVNQEDIFQYFGGIVLRDGGEVGLHGYNHVPFCMEKDGKNQILSYPTWDSQMLMQSAALELVRFSSSMLPGQPFTTYVPPSNLLCDDARVWLPEILPELKVIASVYLPDAKVPAYVQEFEEAKDGIIEYPRITSGYDPNNFMQWVQANEIWLHYAAGHFIHPDDILDSSRSDGKTWLELREALDEYLLWLYSSMPGIRNLSTTEGAMAVQRYARLTPIYNCINNKCRITLDGFYDEGWLLMHTKNKPVTITNGSLTEVSENLFLIQADTAHLLIGFEE